MTFFSSNALNVLYTDYSLVLACMLFNGTMKQLIVFFVSRKNNKQSLLCLSVLAVFSAKSSQYFFSLPGWRTGERGCFLWKNI